MIHEKVFRDPIHDLIPFDRDKTGDRLLLALIDTREVQRLRRIKQLGMAHMAYQGAEHSRFAHSIGVLHLARRMTGRLERDRPTRSPLAVLATWCAGLLHDAGHGPFSHVMEQFFVEKHEAWTHRIVRDEDTEAHALLRGYDPELPELVSQTLKGHSDPAWLSSVVNSQMDADRFDYLLRDAHMTGVKYGVFDLERLLLLLRVSEGGERVVVSHKGLMPVEKYLQSRYQMYRQVYFHKTVTAAEAMLMLLLRRARDLVREGAVVTTEVESPLQRLLNEGTVAVDDYLSLDDSVLYSAMVHWTRHGDPVLRDLSRRLLTRDLFKSVEIEAEEGLDILFDSRIMAARGILERHGLDFNYYLGFSKSADTPYRPYSPRDAQSTIWIRDQGGELVDVKDLSPTVRAFTESPYTIYRAFFPATAPDGTPVRRELEETLTG